MQAVPRRRLLRQKIHLRSHLPPTPQRHRANPPGTRDKSTGIAHRITGFEPLNTIFGRNGPLKLGREADQEDLGRNQDLCFDLQTCSQTH